MPFLKPPPQNLHTFLSNSDDPEIQQLFRRCADELTYETSRLTSFDADGILGLIHTGYAAAHATTSRIIYASKPYAMALGYVPSELEWNMRWTDLVEVGEGGRDAKQEITRQLEAIKNFGVSPEASRRTWRHKRGHPITGTCRYYGARTSDIRCFQGEDDETIADGFPVIICEARFDHFNTSAADDQLKAPAVPPALYDI